MQFKPEATAAQIEEVRTNLANGIAAVAACLASDDLILAWDNGLAVAFDDAGKPHAIGIPHATAVTELRPYPIRNGANKLAKLTKRSTAAANYLPTIINAYREAFC